MIGIVGTAIGIAAGTVDLYKIDGGLMILSDGGLYSGSITTLNLPVISKSY